MKKKYLGATAIDDEDRKEIIERMINSNEEMKKWLTPYYGLMEDNDTENLGGATKEIIKKCLEEEGMPVNTTFITILPMHRLDMSVRITESIAYNEAKMPKEYK